MEIDTHCALALARIAVQALAEASPENHVRVLNAIDDAIDHTRLDEGASAQAVVGLLSDFKLRLVEAARESQVWYVDE